MAGQTLATNVHIEPPPAPEKKKLLNIHFLSGFGTTTINENQVPPYHTVQVFVMTYGIT